MRQREKGRSARGCAWGRADATLIPWPLLPPAGEGEERARVCGGSIAGRAVL